MEEQAPVREEALLDPSEREAVEEILQGMSAGVSNSDKDQTNAKRIRSWIRSLEFSLAKVARDNDILEAQVRDRPTCWRILRPLQLCSNSPPLPLCSPCNHGSSPRRLRLPTCEVIFGSPLFNFLDTVSEKALSRCCPLVPLLVFGNDPSDRRLVFPDNVRASCVFSAILFRNRGFSCPTVHLCSGNLLLASISLIGFQVLPGHLQIYTLARSIQGTVHPW